MKAVAIMMFLVGTIIYSGAQSCAPGDDFCLYMQRIGEAVKVSPYEIHQIRSISVFVLLLFVSVVDR